MAGHRRPHLNITAPTSSAGPVEDHYVEDRVGLVGVQVMQMDRCWNKNRRIMSITRRA
jgi:hypothetical protein